MHKLWPFLSWQHTNCIFRSRDITRQVQRQKPIWNSCWQFEVSLRRRALCIDNDKLHFMSCRKSWKICMIYKLNVFFNVCKPNIAVCCKLYAYCQKLDWCNFCTNYVLVVNLHSKLGGKKPDKYDTSFDLRRPNRTDSDCILQFLRENQSRNSCKWPWRPKLKTLLCLAARRHLARRKGLRLSACYSPMPAKMGSPRIGHPSATLKTQ